MWNQQQRRTGNPAERINTAFHSPAFFSNLVLNRRNLVLNTPLNPSRGLQYQLKCPENPYICIELPQGPFESARTLSMTIEALKDPWIPPRTLQNLLVDLWISMTLVISSSNSETLSRTSSLTFEPLLWITEPCLRPEGIAEILLLNLIMQTTYLAHWASLWFGYWSVLLEPS